MHVVDDVPLLTAFTPLTVALTAMRTHQRSAVVRESPLTWDLILIPDLFEGLIQQLSELENITVSTPVYPITAADVSSWSLDLNQPDSTKSAYERLLDSVGYLYGFIKPLAGTVTIVTRHEPDGDPIRAVPRQCQCRGLHRHPFPLPHVASGQPCPKCRAKVYCF